MHAESDRRGAVKLLLLAAALLVAAPGVQGKPPDGWPFVEYNEAVRLAKRTHKPIFVYFGFPTCPYCEIANKNTFSVEALRKRYTDHYVLAYFDIRGNPADVMTLPDGEKITRAEANKRLRSAPVPAWMFVSPEGREILMRRGSRTPVEAFMQFDQYVSSSAYQRATFENFLAQRGWHEARAPRIGIAGADRFAAGAPLSTGLGHMAETWRVIDTGLRAAAQNIALDRALLEARHAEEIPRTLRFCRFAPSVLLASRQSVAHETHPDFCRGAGFAIQRRLTGGDALYCDGAQLGWALYLHQRDVGTPDMRAVARRICHAVAAALVALGADARYRAPADIVVAGRRIGTAGGVFEGAALLCQGVLYFDLDVATVLSAMRTPGTGVAGHAVAAARARMGDLRTALVDVPAFALVRDRLVAAFESEFAIEFQEADLSLTEHARYQSALAETDTPGWIDLVRGAASEVTVATAAHEHPAGVLHASVLYDRARRRIKQVWFTVEGKHPPAPALLDLEAELHETAVERLERTVHAFFSGHAVEVPGLIAADFIAVLRRALQLPLVVPNS